MFLCFDVFQDLNINILLIVERVKRKKMSFLFFILIWIYLVMCDRIEWSFFYLDYNKVIVFCIFFLVVLFIIFYEVGCKSNRIIILEVIFYLIIKCKFMILIYSGDGLFMGMIVLI